MVNVVFDSQQHITGLTQEEILRIKKDLTFDNPKYIQANKYSKYEVTKIPKFLYIYSFSNGVLSVPVGYKLSLEREAVYTDNRVYGDSINLPPLLITLRENQVEAKNEYLCKNYAYNVNGVIQMATGKGKTITSLSIVSELKLKTLVVVHKDDLIVSWKQGIKDCFGDLDVGLIKAKSRKIGAEITLATAQTLSRLPQEELENLYKTFGIVIHDEVHNSPSTQFSITSKFPARYKIGLSATPERSDGLTQLIHLYFGDKCYVSEYDIETETDILPVEVYVKSLRSVTFDPIYRVTKKGGVITAIAKRVGDKYDNPKYQLKDNEMRLSDLPRNKKPELSYHDIDDAVVLDQDYGDTVLTDILNEYDKGRSIVVFISKKEHCRIYYECLKDYVGDKVQLYYGDSKESNAELMRRAEEREVLITITTLAKGTEGTDVKAWEIAFLVSSMNNGKNVEQAIGRIRRTKEGKISPCIVYDYRVPNVPMMAHHGLTRDKRYREMKCKIITNKDLRRLKI